MFLVISSYENFKNSLTKLSADYHEQRQFASYTVICVRKVLCSRMLLVCISGYYLSVTLAFV